MTSLSTMLQRRPAPRKRACTDRCCTLGVLPILVILGAFTGAAGAFSLPFQTVRETLACEGRRRRGASPPRILWHGLSATTITNEAGGEFGAEESDVSDCWVSDPDEWIRWSSDSLERVTGSSLWERVLGTTSPDPNLVHTNERWAVLSHGIQDNPLYHYFNIAAARAFHYPNPKAAAGIPSSQSAPPGPERSIRREADVQRARDMGVVHIPYAIRQTHATGSLVAISDLILWDVWDDHGNRVGQTALFDAHRVVPWVGNINDGISKVEKDKNDKVDVSSRG